MTPNYTSGVGPSVKRMVHLLPLLVLALPFFTTTSSALDVVTYVVVYGLLAMSLNLLVGYGGMISFGHAMFFALGAYGFCLGLQAGWTAAAAMAVAVLSTAAIAMVVGSVCVRLRETHFSFITLAVAMFLYNTIEGWSSLTGGDNGLTGMVRSATFLRSNVSAGVARYIFIAAIFCVCVFAMYAVVRSSFGATLRMIRDNESRCGYMGINVYATKLAAFTLAAVFASVSGVLATLLVSGAYPTMALWTTSGDALFAILLGGSRVFYGPLAGAALLRVLIDGTTRYTGNTSLVLGVLILLLVLVLRKSPIDLLNERLLARRGSERTRALAPQTRVGTSTESSKC